MATSAQIKSDNNTLIRVKTTAKSITKVNVADQLDAGIDYSVQELALKVDKVAGERLINTTEITKLANTSGTNTGDQDISGKEDISNKSTNVTTDGASDTKYPSVKAVKTYVDTSVSPTTYTVGNIDQINATPVPLIYSFNIISYDGGYSYLPSPSVLGKEIIVATNYTTNIQANISNTDKLITTFPNSVTSIVMSANQVRRFTYIGLGTGTGGLTDGYWITELVS